MKRALVVALYSGLLSLVSCGKKSASEAPPPPVTFAAEGLPEGLAGATVPKFGDDGLLLVHAGGGAGLFSAIIGGWIKGPGGSQPVTREVTP